MPHSTCGFLLVYGSKDNIQSHFKIFWISWNIAESGAKHKNKSPKKSIFSVDVISCISAHGTIHFYDYHLTILFISAAMHPHLLLCCQGLWSLMKLIVTYNIYPIVYMPLDWYRGKDLHRKLSVSYSIF